MTTADLLHLLVYGALPAYLIGSIPFGIIVAKLFGLGNLREIGSGNIGATNVVRAGGKKFGALVLLLDIAKGAIGFGWAGYQIMRVIAYSEENGDYSGDIIATLSAGQAAMLFTLVHLALLAVFLGHVFPVWLRFRGGKGISIVIGALLTLTMPMFMEDPLSYPIYFITLIPLTLYISVWIGLFKWLRVSSIAGIGATFSLPLLFLILMVVTWVVFDEGPTIRTMQPFFFSCFVFFLILYTHRENIRRLLRGEELAFKTRNAA